MTLSLGKSALILFVLSMFIPFLGLPAFRYGWYTQIEFLTAGFWFVGGLAAIWNVYFFKSKPTLARIIYGMPVVWSWIPLILLSVIISLFQPSPLQSWTSNPQLGDGILTFMSLLFLSPLFILIARNGRLKQWLLWIPTFVILITSTLTILGALGTPVPSLQFWKWSPIFFPDYITYFALALGVLYAYTRSKEKLSPLMDSLFFVILVAMIYYAKNHTILMGIGLSLFTYGALKIPLFQKIPLQKKLAYYAGAGLLTLTIFICLTSFIKDLPSAMNSIISRAHIGQFTFITYLNNDLTFSKCLTFLFGQGWGDYNNTAVANLTLLEDFSLFEGSTYKSRLEFVDRDQVNSHNIFLEYFLALGFVGLSLFCYLHYKIISNLRKRFLFIGTFFIITLGTLLIFWFQLPHTLPFITLAYCLLFSKTPSKKLPLRKIKKAPWIAGFSAILLLLISTIQFLSAYKYTSTVSIRPDSDLFDKIDESTQSVWLMYDRYTGAHRTRQIMQGLSNDVFAYLSQTKNPPLKTAGDKILKIVTYLQEDVPSGSSLTSLILSMNIMSKFSIHPITVKLFKQDRKYEDAWHKTANLVSQHLPYRSDVFTPYFSYCLFTKQYEKIEHLCNYFISKRTNDPLAHWFLGTVYLQENHLYEKGLCLMKRAIDLGISKYIPVPQNQINQIQQAAQYLQCYMIL